MFKLMLVLLAFRMKRVLTQEPSVLYFVRRYQLVGSDFVFIMMLKYTIEVEQVLVVQLQYSINKNVNSHKVCTKY